MDRRSVIKNAGIAGILAAGAAPAVHALLAAHPETMGHCMQL